MADIASITIESDVVVDAINELLLVHERLARRHGDTFRALDREIDRLIDMGAGALVADTRLDGDASRILLIPSPPVTAVLKRARELSVI